MNIHTNWDKRLQSLKKKKEKNVDSLVRHQLYAETYGFFCLKILQITLLSST